MVFIIGEAGVNHNGDINLAYKLIDAAVDAGVDAVKFQLFKSNKLVTANANKANYQKETTLKDESQLNMLKKLELSFEDHIKLKNYCAQKNIMFLSSPFDQQSIDELLELDVSIFKIPSGEITNYPYLKKLSKINKKIILSTGMCTLEEIEDAIKVLTSNGNKNISLLHCNTQYPTPFEHVNLNAMITLKQKFGLEVGYSDHTIGIVAPIVAVSLGATIIEKHFTLDNNMEGPDHSASIEPDELKQMVQSIRIGESCLGSFEKKPSESELANIKIVRKSIVAKTSIKKGEIFTIENITTKRPATGISPMKWESIIGSVSEKDYESDDLI